MTHQPITLVCAISIVACAPQPDDTAAVRPGIEVLLDDSSHLLTDRRIGLLTNQTGVDRAGIDDLERLLAAGAQVTAIFSPEHGYRGALDRDGIGHGVDSATGTRVWSLYGSVREPTAVMLRDVDVVLVDLQDIGARPYTYISTVLLTMRAAQREGKPVVVLDRPNPIGGERVQGPILDISYSSFVGMLPVPLRHGMTLGELARLGNDVLGIGADLTVVPADGWRRSSWFDETRLPWVRPSPNMPNLESASHYPGTVLFEATNLSVGRGTPIAFQVIGAPWLDARAVVQRVTRPPGVGLSDTTVTPLNPPDGKHGGHTIPVVRLAVTDRAVYDPVYTAVALLGAIRAVHPESLQIRSDRFDRLAGGDRPRRAIERGDPVATIAAGWRDELAAFMERRVKYLLYQ